MLIYSGHNSQPISNFYCWRRMFFIFQVLVWISYILHLIQWKRTWIFCHKPNRACVTSCPFMKELTDLSLFVYKSSSVPWENVRIALFVSAFISFISIQNIKMMENKSIDENLSVLNYMRRLKHWLVFIAYCAPMFLFLLNILIWVCVIFKAYTHLSVHNFSYI